MDLERLSDSFLDDALQVARDIASAAGELVLDYFEVPEKQKIQFKGVRDPVTEADLCSERLIRERLAKAFPEHSIVAEEEGERSCGSRFRWYVDPLDGTVNFAHGLPLFSVALALEVDGELVLSVVHAPRLQETFTARRGGGAWCNGKRLSVSRTDTLLNALVCTGFHYRRHELPDSNVQHFADFVMKVRGIRRLGSASCDLAYVAAGRLDAYWELHLAPWDKAPGALLVREAGGSVTDMGGGGGFMDADCIVASNGSLHRSVLEVLNRRSPSP
ncbi:MAG: inositol monophosphatase family protein [Planctomycetota bacterium]